MLLYGFLPGAEARRPTEGRTPLWGRSVSLRRTCWYYLGTRSVRSVVFVRPINAYPPRVRARFRACARVPCVSRAWTKKFLAPIASFIFSLYICRVHDINCITNLIIMFTISIKSESGTSSVPVSRVSELEQAISFGFQLHQASTCKHLITVSDGTQTVASFMRVETFTLPAPAPADPSEQKKTFGLRRK